MSKTKEVIVLELTPILPDTIAAAKRELIPLIETTLSEAGRGHVLTDEHIQIQIEKTFPTDAAIIVGLTLLSGIALETYKGLILPELKRRFGVKQRSKRQKKKGKE